MNRQEAMNTSYLRRTIRESLSDIVRECRILATPPPRPSLCWLFLVGCYNSGTTLLAQMLARHPDIASFPTEGHFITNQFVKDFDVGLPRMWSRGEHLFRLTEQDEGPDAQRIKKEWGMRLDRRKPVFLEKSPPNTARTRWLQSYFAPARFVAIVRNGYAVAEGIRRKADPHHLPASWPIEDCARQWVRSNEMLQKDSSYLDHLLWVSYESLAESPKDVLNNIARFAGLEDFPTFNTDDALVVHERKQPIADLNNESIERLSAQDIATINRIAGPTLEKFGYEILNPDAKTTSDK
ncbi:sulfotransferase family protein [Lentisalinibacter sediminis]|uniref:sulfotransferase family protein n=1 Tax=Lentisalinibacter sediminis TaxID=2992237 RepID=UPI003863F4A4